jgi:hypothetical protein
MNQQAIERPALNLSAGLSVIDGVYYCAAML